MKNKRSLTASILSLGLMSSLSAQVLINVDLGAGTSVTTTDVAGVVPSVGWQVKSGFPNFTDLALNLSDGSASGARISGDLSGNVSSTGASTTDANYTMYNRGGGIKGVDNGGSTLSVAGLGTDFTGGGYSVYVYFGSAINFATNNPYTLSFSDGTTTYYAEVEENVATYSGSFSRAVSTASGSPTTSSNYVLFEGLTSASFTITAANIDNVTTDSSAVLTGMQIVAVPEPSTGALLAGAGMFLMVLRRRRRA